MIPKGFCEALGKTLWSNYVSHPNFQALLESYNYNQARNAEPMSNLQTLTISS